MYTYFFCLTNQINYDPPLHFPGGDVLVCPNQWIVSVIFKFRKPNLRINCNCDFIMTFLANS